MWPVSLQPLTEMAGIRGRASEQRLREARQKPVAQPGWDWEGELWDMGIAVQPWLRYLTSLGLRFLICKMVPPHRVVERLHCDNT